MKLTENQMFEYIFCPVRYEMKYVKGLALPDYVTMDKLLNKVAKYFYINLLNGKICSINELKNKWDSICKANEDFIDAKKNLAGIGLIVNLVNWASKEKIVVLDIDTKYSLVLNNIELEGCLGGPILSRPNGGMELLITNFSSKIPDQTELDMKLKYSLDSLAFKTIFNKELEGLKIHLVKNFTDIKTIRSKHDYDRIASTIINVAKGIEQEIFYPRENVICSSCSANHYCKYWS